MSPIYDFRCIDTECGQQKEMIVKPDTEEIQCPKCGKTAKRSLSVQGVSFRFNYMEG